MRYASDYAAHIRSLLNRFTDEGILIRQSRPIKIWIAPGNTRGTVSAYQPGLIYQDGAFLRIDEEFYFDEAGALIRAYYTYHYERPGGYYFRFEREQHDEDPLYKPEHHLHVCWRLPHFPAPPVTLAETLDFIRINFYSSHHQRLVGQSFAIHI